MRFAVAASVALIALLAVPAQADPGGAVLNACKTKDILMRAKSFVISPAYLDVICPCIVGKMKAKIKPGEIQAFADAMNLPPEKRMGAMRNNRAAATGADAFIRGQRACAEEHPLKKR